MRSNLGGGDWKFVSCGPQRRKLSFFDQDSNGVIFTSSRRSILRRIWAKRMHQDLSAYTSKLQLMSSKLVTHGNDRCRVGKRTLAPFAPERLLLEAALQFSIPARQRGLCRFSMNIMITIVHRSKLGMECIHGSRSDCLNGRSASCITAGDVRY